MVLMAIRVLVISKIRNFREKQRLEQLAAKKERDRPRQMLEKQIDPAIQAELQAQKEREEVACFILL